MKKSVIKSAKTLEEAISLALKELNTTRDMVDIDIIEQPSSGFLGLIGVKPAIIKVVENGGIKKTAAPMKSEEKATTKKSVKETKIAKGTDASSLNKSNKQVDIVDFVQQLCNNIVSNCIVKKESENEEGISISINGDNIGLIVGKHGETLNSIQYLTSMIYSKQIGSYRRVSIDAGGYREKRKEKIIEFGTRMADKARRTGRRISLEPMNSYERRIVHMALQDAEGINTFSEGDDPNRRVVITPSGNRQNNRYQKRNNKKLVEKHAKEERNYSTIEKQRHQIENNKSEEKPKPKKTKQSNQTKQSKQNNKKTEENNPYEHYYSKYDNRYKKK